MRWILFQISVEFVAEGPVDNEASLVQFLVISASIAVAGFLLGFGA